MLDPHDRQVYLDALKPPDGYVLGEAVATTYSLDLTTLLGVPVALVLPHLDPARLTAENAVDVLQALRQVSSRLSIFCNLSCIAAPAAGVLYSMLEPVIVEARAPHGGSLHAKMWLIRFDPVPGEEGEPCMRFVALSRNLTNDRSWDVSVVLDGSLSGRRRIASNNPLVELLKQLPGYALRPVTEQTGERLARLAEDVARTDWELPPGFDELAFHVLGIGKRPKPWLPEQSDRLVVMSPFITAPALTALQGTTKQAVALIARTEELDRCDPAVVTEFDATYVLADAAAREDGEDSIEQASGPELRGLHAKVLLAKRGWNTHLYLGSANATTSALTAGRNIELMVELSGKTSAVPGKGIDGLLDSSGMGSLLVPYDLPTQPPVVDAAAERAEQALRNAAQTLAQAGLRLRFDGAGDEYSPSLSAASRFALPGVQEVWAWLITSDKSSARQVHGLGEGKRVALAACASAGATGLVAFELLAGEAPIRQAFVLNLPVECLPSDRDAHIVRLVVKNRERLMHYLMSLLQGMDPYVRAGLESNRQDGAGALGNGLLGSGLLEHLVRAKARTPERLAEVRSVLAALTSTEQGRALVPSELLTLWTTVTGEVLG